MLLLLLIFTQVSDVYAQNNSRAYLVEANNLHKINKYLKYVIMYNIHKYKIPISNKKLNINLKKLNKICKDYYFRPKENVITGFIIHNSNYINYLYSNLQEVKIFKETMDDAEYAIKIFPDELLKNELLFSCMAYQITNVINQHLITILNDCLCKFQNPIYNDFFNKEYTYYIAINNFEEFHNETNKILIFNTSSFYDIYSTDFFNIMNIDEYIWIGRKF